MLNLLGGTNIRNRNFLERLGAPRDASNMVSLASFFQLDVGESTESIIVVPM